MIVLGIDTSTRTGSVAIIDSGRVVAETEGTGKLGAALIGMIDAACVGAAIGPFDLDAVAIGAGPGSFTGLRIGMATAKGIAFAAKCPLWVVSSLAALAYPDVDGVVAAVLDARRGEYYAGAYRRDAERLVTIAEDRVLSPEGLGAFVAASGAARVVGDVDGLDEYRLPTAAAVAQLALAGPRIDALVGAAPAYIRASEAEIRYPDGVPGALRRR